MRIEELSVGDWVRTADQDIRGSRECIIQSIERWSNGDVLVVRFKDGGIETLGIGCFVPILLTAEILERNGWLPPRAGLDFDTWWWTNKVDVAIEASEYQGEWQLTIIEQKEIQYNYRLGLGLKYVHELQHALTLAKIDKDIVL